MARFTASDFGGLLLVFAIVGTLLVITVLVTPVAIVGIIGYVGYRLYTENPARLERLARNETEALYAHALAGTVTLSAEEIEAALSRHWPADLPGPLRLQLLQVGRAIFDEEGLSPDVPPPPGLCNSVEGARYRDMLARRGQARHDRAMVLQAVEIISEALQPIANAVPPIEGDVLVEITQFTHPMGTCVQNVIAPFFRDNDYMLFKSLRERLDANLRTTHRTNPIYPADYKHDDIVDTYLRGTHLKALFSLRTPFTIPEERRFEHTHMVAGSGHGKTQTLQYFIGKDIEAVARGAKSVVVIDSQGDLINTILKADLLGEDQIVLIDPEDIHYPVCLNLFSVGQDRLEQYDPLERERLTNSIIELYDFVLGSLLSAGMTAKQSVVFRYVTRLMFHIPNATIHTLRELLEPEGTDIYWEAINKLEGTPRRFFETEFDTKEFTNTRTQVLRRLYGVLENQTFERMFSHPQSKFDKFQEMNAGKLILINTSKSLLKEQGTEIFGRFFIALIAQAAQERATLPGWDRLPVMVYVDEAQDYFDKNIGIILSQARKYKVGMVMAHQYLGQLTNGLQEAFEANTSIKLAGGVSARDARAISGQLGTDAEIIQNQPKGTFVTFIRGLTDRGVPMSFPFFTLEKAPKRSPEALDAIRAASRAAYAEPWAQKKDPGPGGTNEDNDGGVPPPTGGSDPRGGSSDSGAHATSDTWRDEDADPEAGSPYGRVMGEDELSEADKAAGSNDGHEDETPEKATPQNNTSEKAGEDNVGWDELRRALGADDDHTEQSASQKPKPSKGEKPDHSDPDDPTDPSTEL